MAIVNLVSIIGSHHGLKGNTGRLLEYVIQGAESLGATNESIVLRGDSVLPCMGCDHCHRKGNCVQNDDFESIKGKILSADGLILASPNYIYSVSAQLKAFMDRCCGIIHCLGFEGKYGASVVTSGGGDEPPISDYMNHFLITVGIVPVGGVWATMGTISGDEFPPDIRKKAFDLGHELVTAWQSKKKPLEIAEAMDTFHDRMENMMRYRGKEWTYEYEYWVEHHGLKD